MSIQSKKSIAFLEKFIEHYLANNKDNQVSKIDDLLKICLNFEIKAGKIIQKSIFQALVEIDLTKYSDRLSNQEIKQLFMLLNNELPGQISAEDSNGKTPKDYCQNNQVMLDIINEIGQANKVFYEVLSISINFAQQIIKQKEKKDKIGLFCSM